MLAPSPCGAVQIFDLANSTYARLAQERSDWLRATAALSEADNPPQRQLRPIKKDALSVFFYWSE